jgi:hypothetical protein
MRNEFNGRVEDYTERIEGVCSCGHRETVVKYVHSSLTGFKHGNRYTHLSDRELGGNIFRCAGCMGMIEETFTPNMEGAK